MPTRCMVVNTYEIWAHCDAGDYFVPYLTYSEQELFLHRLLSPLASSNQYLLPRFSLKGITCIDRLRVHAQTLRAYGEGVALMLNWVADLALLLWSVGRGKTSFRSQHSRMMSELSRNSMNRWERIYNASVFDALQSWAFDG